jgi:hypothetical protein
VDDGIDRGIAPVGARHRLLQQLEGRHFSTADQLAETKRVVPVVLCKPMVRSCYIAAQIGCSNFAIAAVGLRRTMSHRRDRKDEFNGARCLRRSAARD